MGEIIDLNEYLNKIKEYTAEDFSKMVEKLYNYTTKLEELIIDEKYSKQADRALADFHLLILKNYFSILEKMLQDNKNPLYNEAIKDLENLIISLKPIEKED